MASENRKSLRLDADSSEVRFSVAILAAKVREGFEGILKLVSRQEKAKAWFQKLSQRIPPFHNDFADSSSTGRQRTEMLSACFHELKDIIPNVKNKIQSESTAPADRKFCEAILAFVTILGEVAQEISVQPANQEEAPGSTGTNHPEGAQALVREIQQAITPATNLASGSGSVIVLGDIPKSDPDGGASGSGLHGVSGEGGSDEQQGQRGSSGSVEASASPLGATSEGELPAVQPRQGQRRKTKKTVEFATDTSASSAGGSSSRGGSGGNVGGSSDTLKPLVDPSGSASASASEADLSLPGARSGAASADGTHTSVRPDLPEESEAHQIGHLQLPQPTHKQNWLVRCKNNVTGWISNWRKGLAWGSAIGTTILVGGLAIWRTVAGNIVDTVVTNVKQFFQPLDADSVDPSLIAVFDNYGSRMQLASRSRSKNPQNQLAIYLGMAVLTMFALHRFAVVRRLRDGVWWLSAPFIKFGLAMLGVGAGAIAIEAHHSVNEAFDRFGRFPSSDAPGAPTLLEIAQNGFQQAVQPSAFRTALLQSGLAESVEHPFSSLGATWGIIIPATVGAAFCFGLLLRNKDALPHYHAEELLKICGEDFKTNFLIPFCQANREYYGALGTNNMPLGPEHVVYAVRDFASLEQTTTKLNQVWHQAVSFLPAENQDQCKKHLLALFECFHIHPQDRAKVVAQAGRAGVFARGSIQDPQEALAPGETSPLLPLPDAASSSYGQPLAPLNSASSLHNRGDLESGAEQDRDGTWADEFFEQDPGGFRSACTIL